MGDADKLADKAAMNQILLDLPSRRPHTACVDARDLKTHIGDNVHFDTAAQNEIGKRFAEKYSALTTYFFSSDISSILRNHTGCPSACRAM